MLERYRELEGEVARLLGNFAILASLLREPAMMRGAGERLRRLRLSEFHIAVVSEFNNGKSTLINALLGTDLLPTHYRPLTATITRISYGNTARVEIHFKDGRKAVCTPSDSDLRRVLNHFSTTLTDQAREVEEVRVRYPLPLSRRGLVLIDTPGLESIYDPHNRITRRVLPEADAVLLVVEAGKIGRIADLQLVRQLRFVRKHPVFIALNKVDHLRSPAEVADAVRYLGGLLRGVINESRIFPVSGLQALQARRLKQGAVQPADLGGDRRLYVHQGSHFRPIRHASDWEALEQASGIRELEEGLATFLLGGERAREALASTTAYVLGNLAQSVLPNLRRLEASLSIRKDHKDSADLQSRISSAREEVAAAQTAIDSLLGPDGLLVERANAIWEVAAERRLGPRSVALLIEGIGRSLVQKGIKIKGEADRQQVVAALDYAVNRLSSATADDLETRWAAALDELRRTTASRLREVSGTPTSHPEGGENDHPRWQSGFLGGIFRRGHRFNPFNPMPPAKLLSCLQGLAAEPVLRARGLLENLHRQHRESAEKSLRRYCEESLDSLRQNLVRLEAAIHAERESVIQLQEVTRNEAEAQRLLDEAGALLDRFSAVSYDTVGERKVM